MAKGGRSKGSRNRGFFYRSGRGWVASEGSRCVPLGNPDGSRLRDRNARLADVKAAYQRYLEQKKAEAEEATRAAEVVESAESRSKTMTVAEVCRLYLDYSRDNDADSTYTIRADSLFDFCTGFPASLRTRDERPPGRRIHKGFGELRVSQLIPLHVDQWLAAHPRWSGCRRAKIKSLLRAFNYCVDAGVLPRNPIKGYKPGKDNVRRAYFTSDQEQAMYETSPAEFALALRVCIRTGARPGCEFAAVTAAHVREHEKGLEWHFSEEESKTNKPRIIRIADPEIVKIVRRQMKQHPTGPLFRNTHGEPWSLAALGHHFTTVRKRLEKLGVTLDKDACMYACRHTFAKRTLQGYWTGKKCNLETLCHLMGNSLKICWEHYAEWCDTYTDPLWEAA